VGRPEVWSAIVAACSAVGFVVLATRDIELPGLYYDELFEVVPSLAFAKGGLPTSCQRSTRA
jgi:hypothetical protein